MGSIPNQWWNSCCSIAKKRHLTNRQTKNQSSVCVLQQTEEKKILRADARMYIYKIWTTKKWLVESFLCVKNKLPIKPYILCFFLANRKTKKVKTPIIEIEKEISSVFLWHSRGMRQLYNTSSRINILFNSLYWIGFINATLFFLVIINSPCFFFNVSNK